MRLAELQQLTPQLHELLARHGTSNPAVFGSSLFDRAELKSALEDQLRTRVDLIRRRNLKPELKATVEAEAIPL
ncbi:MAG: nucleotidyltransferase [Cyanobium sp. PLM2.Bin73]|jgi:predicted nucleotidyltransferase|nr:MAG: nucleotidyltransferase [Cyanobium sp. PLM2.Bin73]